ncbi:MAG: hypothetical protein EBU66_13550 [Bacteroidetes bacterium]|nr:hypothetical protein [bacterium]NBP65671.1 hypothetical protein [Bacteroidota bacterium]
MKEKIKISHIISLGCNCHTSMFLKNCGFKKYSCPFDWISIKFKDVVNILNSNFDTFINPEFLIDHADKNNMRCGHALYGSHMFHHFNPRTPQHKAYYERCIQRFKNLKNLPNDEIVLFIYNEFYEPQFNSDDILSLRNLLQLYRGNDRFVLLIIKNTCNYDKTSTLTTSEYKVDYQLESLLVLNCKLVGHTTGVGFSNHIDHVCSYNLLTSIFNIHIKETQKEDYLEKTAYDISL